MNQNDAIVVMTTFDNADAANALARQIVENRLAACVQVLPPMTSTYRWQSKIETAQEYLALIKTRRDHWPALEQFIREHHPYETPEILAIPAVEISDRYQKWLVAETGD
ncbi:divalent-cation tolerance protein CutA [bacterium]|nr:divalent-cation tolerance protein CutA [bacterium]